GPVARLVSRRLEGLAPGCRLPHRRGIGVRPALPAGHARRDHGTDRRLRDRGWCRAARGSVQTPLARAAVGADMAQLSLTDKEGETLTKALEAYLSDLRMEIGDTDAHDFREGLKQEESVITRLLERLRKGLG